MKQNGRSSLGANPSISEAALLPILHSIVDADGNSLRYLELPQKWRNNRSFVLVAFLRKYNALMRNHGCSKCNRAVEPPFITNAWLHNNTCYDCLNIFCGCGTTTIIAQDYPFFGRCEMCKKDYCKDCNQVMKCFFCKKYLCIKCSSMKECGVCVELFCRSCAPSYACACWSESSHGEALCVDHAPEIFDCETAGCNERCCSDCADGKLDQCDICRTELCSECRYLKCIKVSDPDRPCSGCLKLAATTIISKQNEREQENQKLLGQLREEIQQLHQEVKDLREENNNLLSKMHS